METRQGLYFVLPVSAIASCRLSFRFARFRPDLNALFRLGRQRMTGRCAVRIFPSFLRATCWLFWQDVDRRLPNIPTLAAVSFPRRGYAR